MWWVRPWLALRARHRQYDTLLQGLKPRILQFFYQDGSVAVPRNFARVGPLIEKSIRHLPNVLNY